MSEDRDRQLERTREALAARDDEPRTEADEQQASGADRTEGDRDVRLENARHAEKRADGSDQ